MKEFSAHLATHATDNFLTAPATKQGCRLKDNSFHPSIGDGACRRKTSETATDDEHGVAALKLLPWRSREFRHGFFFVLSASCLCRRLL